MTWSRGELVVPAGQALQQGYYPGIKPAVQGAIGRPGQHLVPGPEVTDERHCTHRPESGVRCKGWGVKDDPLGLCAGHRRAYDKKQVETSGDEPSADQGLRQDAPGP